MQLESVRKVYGDAHNCVVALAGVTIGFQQGSFTAVMGPSGSGKSTLLQTAAGLVRPTLGSVVVDGRELTGLSEAALAKLRRERIGFVFQAFNLLPALTVEQNVTLPLRLAGRRPSRARVAQVIGRVGLADRRGDRPGALSGGQQQRVAIARALVTRPAVILADEPTGALDSHNAREVLGLLRESVRAVGQTVVMVTHDPMAPPMPIGWCSSLTGRSSASCSTRPPMSLPGGCSVWARGLSGLHSRRGRWREMLADVAPGPVDPALPKDRPGGQLHRDGLGDCHRAGLRGG